jgi:hypothetical protein
MYCINNYNGKYWAIFGPKLPGLSGVSDYRGPDYRGTTVRHGSVMPMRFGSLVLFQPGFGLAVTGVPKPNWSDQEHLQDQEQVLMDENHNS